MVVLRSPHDQPLAGKGGPGQGFSDNDAMVRRRDRRQTLAPQALRIQFRIVDRTKRERQVNPVLAESDQLLACGSFPQLESQIPVAGEYSQHPAEYVGAERSKEANG